MSETPEAESVPEFVERVLDLVDSIPIGRVVTYGDIAAHLGEGGPRNVGTVMSLYGSGVPWHRVIRAGGLPAKGHEDEVLRLLAAEGVTIRNGRIDPAARWVFDS